MIDFKGHRFEQDIILTGVRWYLAYPLSYRNQGFEGEPTPDRLSAFLPEAPS